MKLHVWLPAMLAIAALPACAGGQKTASGDGTTPVAQALAGIGADSVLSARTMRELSDAIPVERFFDSILPCGAIPQTDRPGALSHDTVRLDAQTVVVTLGVNGARQTIRFTGVDDPECIPQSTGEISGEIVFPGGYRTKDDYLAGFCRLAADVPSRIEYNGHRYRCYVVKPDPAQCCMAYTLRGCLDF